ncbi:hypothetical protein Tco_0645439 [Tanacetum coccineum]
MAAMRNHITNLKAEIRSEVQATLQNQINSLKGEFKNELKTQHNLFVNQQNEFQNNLQNMLSGFFQNQSQPSTSTSMETEVTKDKVLPSTKDIQPPVIQKSHDPVKPVSSPISPEPSSAQVDNSPPSKESSKETRLPYPSRVEREKKDSNDKVQIQKFWEMFKKIHVDITLADAFDLVSKYQRCKKLVLIRDGLERIVFKPDGSQDNESIHMMDVYDDRFKDVCEPESNDDSTTSAIVDDFKTFSNPLFEKQDDFPSRNDESILKEETFKSYLNPLFEKDEEIISNEASSKISPKVDVKTIMSFFAPIGNCVRKWATSEFVKDNVEISHEVFKSDSENVLGIHDDKEEEIAFLDGLLEDENFFETNDKKVESFERKTKEDFETKDDPVEKRKIYKFFHPYIEILDHLELPLMSDDYVFYDDLNLVI